MNYIKTFNESYIDTRLIDAVNGNDIVTVKELLHIVDPSLQDNKAIRIASYKGFKSIVELLLKDDRNIVDPSAVNNTAIRYASAYGRTGIVELLLKDKRVDPSADKNYAILFAGNQAIVKLLLSDSRVNIFDVIRDFDNNNLDTSVLAINLKYKRIVDLHKKFNIV